MIVFYYKKMILGGAELLIVRLAKALNRRGIANTVLTEKAEEGLIDLFNENKISYIVCNNSEKKLLEMVHINYEVKIVTLFYVDYIRLKYLTKNIHHVITILYCVHMKGMIFGRPIPNPFKSYFLKISRLFIKTGIRNKTIHLMDQETIDRTREYYKFDDNFCRTSMGLPYDFDFNEDDIRENIINRSNTINVISICRADFPFKGYVIGLIEEFAKYNADNKNSNLHVIASGKDEILILDAINKQPDEIRQNIIFHGRVAPPEMKKILSTMHVLIGMGTTMLDAASVGVLAVPVVPGTYECLCAKDFFTDNFLFSVIPNEGTHCLETHLKNITTMDKETYEDECLRSYHVAKDKFSTDSIIETLLDVNSEIELEKSLGLLNLYVLVDRIWKKFK